jgi:hypothetical protein
MKIDVAVQSYRKPESLIYTLLSLHRHSRDAIDTVWINDDRSGGDVLAHYRRLEESGSLSPWKIRVRENTCRMGWWVSFVRGYRPAYTGLWFRLKRMAWNWYKNGSAYVEKEDMRYQWALSHTDKKYLLVIHDDIEFKQDIVTLYLASIQAVSERAIVGDLGQCWRCDFREQGCDPQKLLMGYRPSALWPSTKVKANSHAWACRINEWSALLNVQVANEIAEKEKIFFGNFDANGDTSAYWFSRVVHAGYGFDDPLPTAHSRAPYYKHWDGGITGHSAWVDQGKGKTPYDGLRLRRDLKQEFGYDMEGFGSPDGKPRHD